MRAGATLCDGVHAAVCRTLPAVAACLLLSACVTTRGGHADRAAAPSLVQPGTSTHDNPSVYLTLIRKMQQQGAYYASLAHIDAYRLRYGDTPELQRLQADALRKINQGAAAIPIYRKLLRGDERGAAWHGLGLIAATGGQAAEAEQYLQKAVEIEPINATYLSDLGYARLLAGQLDAAREPLAKSAELAPDNVKIVSNLALWMLLQDHDSQANAVMQQAELPQATRNAVYRLAVQLRHKATSTQAATGAAPTTLSPHHAPGRSEVSGIPGTMLDRFAPPPARTKGNQ